MLGKESKLIKLDDKRNYGVDLLRIVAMFMVVLLHVLGAGGILAAETMSPGTFWTAWFVEIAAYGAVDIYALISGFVGYRGKFRYAGLAELWLRVLLYSVSFAVINKLFVNKTASMKNILFAFFPVTKGGWWYFTMYFALFLFVPLLNAAIEKMTKTGLRNTVIACVFLFSILPFLWNKDTFVVHDGYSLLWLMVLYLIGAYLGKYRAFENAKKPLLFLGYVVCCVITWSAKYVIHSRFPVFVGITLDEDWLVRYTSLPVMLSAVFLLLIFRGITLPKPVKAAIAVIAPLTFSVYVIHTLPVVKEYFLVGKYTVYAAYSPVVMVLAVLGTAAVIFLACAALDFVRARLFDVLKVKARLLRLEEKWLPRTEAAE